MRGGELRKALAAGSLCYGTCLEGYQQPRWPKALAGTGLDFVFIENEHTPHNRETLAWACQAYAAHGVAPLLRIPQPSPYDAAMGMDLGAHGIIAPYIESVEEVKGLVGAVKYRPLKGAALRRVLDQGQYPSPETGPYLQDFNPDAVLIIMIESPAGVENLADMLAIGGVDGVLIGPHDFSVSHGVAEQYDHPVFQEAAQRVVRTCRAAGVGAGIHFIAGDMGREVSWVEWGCNLIVHRADTLFILEGIRRELADLKHLLGQSVPDRSSASLI